MTDLAKIKEELKAEILAELTASKRTDSAWKKAKGHFKEKVFSVFGQCPEGWRVLDSIASLSRAVFGVYNVNRFTEDDITTIERMLDEIFDIAIRYKESHREGIA